MSEETLLTPTPTEQPESAPATPGVDAGAAPAENAQPQPGEADAKPESDPADKSAEDKPQGAPERYEFTAPEGSELDAAVTDAFAGVAKELNLTQEAAQKVVDKMAPLMAQRQAEQVQAVQEVATPLALAYDTVHRQWHTRPGTPGVPRLTYTLTITGTAAFCDALRERFALDADT